MYTAKWSKDNSHLLGIAVLLNHNQGVKVSTQLSMPHSRECLEFPWDFFSRGRRSQLAGRGCGRVGSVQTPAFLGDSILGDAQSLCYRLQL